MTALAIARRRLALRFAGLRIEAVVFAAVVIAALAAVLIATFGPAAAGNKPVATVQLTPAKAAALVAATSASAGELRAVGEQAKLINAALPFSTAPVQAARPFAIGGDALDHRRALLCLTQAVYYEAGFEPAAGRRAVAQVVLNRMRHPAFPKSVCGVVYQVARAPVCQFSFVCDGSLNRVPAAGPWREAKAIAEAALLGHVEAAVGSATHYHANYVSPRWAPMLTKITQMGAHIFYRWPGAWGQRAAFSGRYVGEPHDPLSLRPATGAPAVDVLALAEQSVATAETGPPIARAPSDVGGLLDVSKGWKLNIPAPEEVSSATARALAEQRATKSEPVLPVAAVAAPVVASR